MAARIIPNLDSNFFSFSYGTDIKTSILRKREREREIAAEKQSLANGVVVDDELKEKEGVGGVGFDLEDSALRYKLIGTTSLTFVFATWIRSI
ncbi:hypothetical protein SASPL_128509 [Salvia splendens]|uniref:Uncharacterized protein n=1 Tax=Salvia splendens TaxID=180675 RepID=A0A8X8XCS8_SALSN|nr:hypothetical protein SASPL_128509 [Salvia splendens]